MESGDQILSIDQSEGWDTPCIRGSITHVKVDLKLVLTRR